MEIKKTYKNGRNGAQPKEPTIWDNGTAPDRLQPHNIENEEALIGSILINPDALIWCDEIGITQDDFFIHRNGWVFAAAKKLGAHCDIVSLCDELERQGQLEELGGAAHLTYLLNVTPTSAHAGYYARTVKRDAVRRNLITAAGEIAQLSFESKDDDPTNIIQEASDVLLKVSTNNQIGQARSIGYFCTKFSEALDTYYANENDIVGLPTGLYDLDKILGGLQQGKLILVAGRPGMGKSALVLQMTKTATLKRQAKVLYFSLEMIGDELVERLVSSETGIDTETMRNKGLTSGQFSEINKVVDRISRWPLTIDDITQNIEAIRARAITHQWKHGLDLIVVDYGQRVTVSKNYQNRDAELGAVSAMLKRMANGLKVPVVCVASLSRKCEERHDKRPVLSDLRESGNWEYDADAVIFIYRDEVYNPETQFPNVAELIVAKHRGGRTGSLTTYFKKHVTTFIDLEARKNF
jgi:replicative DNA helicase